MCIYVPDTISAILLLNNVSQSMNTNEHNFIDHLPGATAIFNVKLMTFSNEFKQPNNEMSWKKLRMPLCSEAKCM